MNVEGRAIVRGDRAGKGRQRKSEQTLWKEMGARIVDRVWRGVELERKGRGREGMEEGRVSWKGKSEGRQGKGMEQNKDDGLRQRVRNHSG